MLDARRRTKKKSYISEAFDTIHLTLYDAILEASKQSRDVWQI